MPLRCVEESLPPPAQPVGRLPDSGKEHGVECACVSGLQSCTQALQSSSS
jgi:hypothetical protein